MALTAERPVSNTYLDTLLWYLQNSLTSLNQGIESASHLDFNERAGLQSRLDHVRNTADMVAHTAAAQEGTLLDVACCLNSLADAGRLDPHGLTEAFEKYSDNLGDQAAERLIAAALRT